MKEWCLFVLLCVAPYSTKGLEVTLAGLPANGYVMNPEGGNPQPLNLVCSYTVDPGETAQYVTFFKDGSDTANQIVVIQVSDGNPGKFNSYTTRADVTASGSDPSFTLTIGVVTMADEGRYRCRVSTEFNAAIVTTPAQTLSLLYRPNPPQITRGPQVAIDTYRESCSSEGGRPAPEIKWFKMQTSDQMEVAINATSNTVTPQGDTFLVESTVKVMATQADPAQVFCQLLHDSLTCQIETSIIVPKSAAPSTTTTTKSTYDAALSTSNVAVSTSGIGSRSVTIIVISVIAMCLFCITAYLVFRNRSLSRRLKSQASEQQPASVITNNVTEHSNNVNSPFNNHVSTQRRTDQSSGFDGVYVAYDDTALANGYQELRRDNRSDGQYMELGENQLPSTATNGMSDYNYII